MTDAGLTRAARAAAAGSRPDRDPPTDLLADDDTRVRAAALTALVRRSDPAAPGAVAAGLADADAAVRIRAAELSPAAGLPPDTVVPLLADPDPLVAEAAAWALGEGPGGRAAVDALALAARGHADPLVREAAVAALGALGDPAGLAAVLGGTTDKPAVRRRAVLALAAFEGPEVEAALEAATRDRDWQVRQTADDVLRAGRA